MESGSAQAAAASLISKARALVITAGAGMGVDSGLPDFRGDRGFWNAYPAYERLGQRFVEAANPRHFQSDPHFGWGFYGHRTVLYRRTVPHKGFQIIRRWIDRYELSWFVVTSNVDGQFQKAGFDPDRIFEVHGSIHHHQCTEPCTRKIWPDESEFRIEPDSMRAREIPTCANCARPARPNILMFGDFSWIGDRSNEQQIRFGEFLRGLNGDSRKRTTGGETVVLELGAGTTIPTIRAIGENLVRNDGASLIRVNPRESQAPAGQVPLREGALAALAGIDRLMPGK